MAVQTTWAVSTLLDLTAAVITTDAATAADKVYSPIGFDRNQPGVAKWVDRAGGIPVGFPSVTMSVREPTKASALYKVTVKLDLPTLEQTSPSTATGIQPAPTKAYSCQFVGEFLMPQRATSVERTALLKQVASMFHALINASDGSPSSTTLSPLIAAITNLEPVW